MKKFIIFKDLVVRESTEFNEANLVDAIGVIRGTLTDKTFSPHYFSKSKEGTKAILWEWQIENEELSISPHFTIIKIVERPDTKVDRNYYKELKVQFRDTFGKTEKYIKHFEPEKEIGYGDFQVFLAELNAKLGDSESVGMIKLSLEKEQIQIQLDKQIKENHKSKEKIEELQQKIKELRQKIGELQNENENPII